MYDDAMIAVVMTVDVAWNSACTGGVYLGFLSWIFCEFFVPSGSFENCCDNDYVVPMNGFCAWWASCKLILAAIYMFK